MSELATVARPYAKAAFDLAQKSGDLGHWSKMLTLAANIANDSGVQSLLQHPGAKSEEIARLFKDVSGQAFDAPFENFIKLLGENRRIAALGDIAEQYEAQRRTAESRIKVTVVSAAEMAGDQVERLLAALKSRYKKDVELDLKIDASLVGGAVISAGDEVIDGTVQGRLQKLATSLLN